MILFAKPSNRIYRHIIRFLITLIPLFTVIISTAIYVVNDSSFGFLTHYLSHLGSGPKGAGFVFNIGMVLSGLSMIFFFLNFSYYLRRKNAHRLLIFGSFILGLISSLGGIFLGIFPYVLEPVLHNFSAGFFFIGGLLFCILYGISEWITPEISKIQALTGFFAAFFFILFIVLTSINFFNSYLLLEQAHLTEWILFFVVMIWIVQHELSMTKDKIKMSKD